MVDSVELTREDIRGFELRPLRRARRP